jgi:phosphinothricin acetyltransferase
MKITIRKAQRCDLPRLLTIYNYEVLHGVATLDLNPKKMSEWELWYEAHNIDNHPLYVAEADGIVAGYASLSDYREKEAYRSTVELSVYIDLDFRGKGVATALMEQILADARSDERTHNVVSVITAGNEASECLHRKFGFTYCGRIPAVGMKFGSYLDIENYSLLV